MDLQEFIKRQRIKHHGIRTASDKLTGEILTQLVQVEVLDKKAIELEEKIKDA